ncbi:MAG: Archaeal flagellin [Candidatus Alkanophagales archaeon MCA70_species_1]|nr:Archaeal flagellin [Candidatus Alkanophaga volatiphilum]
MKKMDRKGVSPVIGVILMVAATIVVAAVVLGMLGGFGPPKKSYSVSVSASRMPDGNISVTFVGGPDASLVSSISVNVTDIDYTNKHDTGTLSSIGGTFMTDNGPYNVTKAHVVAIATFADGTSQVVLDTYV